MNLCLVMFFNLLGDIGCMKTCASDSSQHGIARRCADADHRWHEGCVRSASPSSSRCLRASASQALCSRFRKAARTSHSLIPTRICHLSSLARTSPWPDRNSRGWRNFSLTGICWICPEHLPSLQSAMEHFNPVHHHYLC